MTFGRPYFENNFVTFTIKRGNFNLNIPRDKTFTFDAQSKQAFNAARTLITVGFELHLIAESRKNKRKSGAVIVEQRAMPVRNECQSVNHTIVRDNLWHFVNPIPVSRNNVTDIRDVEGVLRLFTLNYVLDNVHVVHVVVEDVYLVEVVTRHDETRVSTKFAPG